MGKVIFFSGAGLSADSGLGTFHGEGGLWDKYDVNKVCNYNTWEDNYALVHEFYDMRREEYAKAMPNPMHKVIGELQKRYGAEKVVAITQNIDDLLEKGGCSNVLHVHGHINFIRCEACGREYEISGAFNGSPCRICAGRIFKPSVVFFGEAAPNYSGMYNEIISLGPEDMIAVIGTLGSVVPISSVIGPKTAGSAGFRLLCNLEKSPYINESYFDKIIYDRAQNAAEEVARYAEKILCGQSV